MNEAIKILVADSEAGRLLAKARALRSAGYSVLEATTGREGLAKAREHHPHLALLETSLGDLEGEELCRHIKAHPALRDTLVVLVGEQLPAIETGPQARQASADAYVARPASEEQVVAHVESALCARHAQARPIIADLERTQRALLESEERYRHLVESSHDWVWEVDEHLVYTFASPKAYEVLGYTPEEIIGKTPFDLMPPDEARRVQEAFGSIAEQHSAFRGMENVNRRKDGRLVILETNGVPVLDRDGRFRGYRGMDRDITERKKMEAELQQSIDEWQMTFDSVADPVMILDEDYTVRRANTATAAFLELPPDQIIGKKCFALMHGTQEPIEGCPFRQVKECRRACESELYHTPKDRWLLASAGPIVDASGKVTGYIHAVRDITDRKRSAEKLARSETLKGAILSSLVTHVAVLDRDGMIIAANDAWHEFARNNGGDEAAIGVGADYYDAVTRAAETDDAGAKEAIEGIRSVMEGRLPRFEYEYPCHSPTEQRWFAMLVVPLRLPEGGVVISHWNVTERRQAQEQLKQAFAALEHRSAQLQVLASQTDSS